MTRPDHHHAAQARWRTTSAWEHGQQFPHGMTTRDRLDALHDDWRRHGARGLLWDLVTLPWNVANLLARR